MVRYKYTPEALAAAAAAARNITEVMRLLGVRVSGGSHAHISRQLKRFNIDTSHFTGSAHNRGARWRRLSPTELLVVLPTARPLRMPVSDGLRSSSPRWSTILMR
ncbi:hypothetical protein [Micromonospora zamorensis]|uniref:hypothetical protein n=1 Tax=Micromonospora zamorensis TaxID=709883 RepID=UPI0033B00E94